MKVFFWMISALALILSGTSAALFLPFFIVHLCLGLPVNPETIRSILGGQVRRSWLEEHHPDGGAEVGSEIHCS